VRMPERNKETPTTNRLPEAIIMRMKAMIIPASLEEDLEENVEANNANTNMPPNISASPNKSVPEMTTNVPINLRLARLVASTGSTSVS